jgi:hypothetical protein
LRVFTVVLAAALVPWLVAGGAGSSAAAAGAPVVAQGAGDPILGYWNFSGGVVQVTGGPTSFTGTIVAGTRFSDCVHPVGEVIWRNVTRTGTSYRGTHQWFGSAAPQCRLGGPSMRGVATWSIMDSGSALRLHFCTTSPERSTDTRCTDLTRAKPVVTWPKLPDAFVSLESVSNGCGGGPAGDNPKYGDDSTFADTEIPFDNLTRWNQAKRYYVNFREACKQHDAGYSHAKVRDMALNGGKVIDYFTYSKAAVDTKFLEDMRKICDAQIPAGARIARNNCKQNGGFHLVSGAKTRYNLVAATTYTQKIWKGLGFYQEPPRLSGAWSTGLAGAGGWTLEQRDRRVDARWSGGRAAPNVTGEFRGTLISYDDSSSIKGYYVVTTDGVPSKVRPMTLYWSPKLPNELRVSTGFTLKR